MFDCVHLAMRRACDNYGGSDGVFNAAGFSQNLTELAGFGTGHQRSIDGKLVEVILCGRDDVEQLHGGSHYRLVAKGVES